MPVPLFEAPIADPVHGRNHFVPSADGRRFLVNVYTPERREPRRVAVVLNWTAALPAKHR